MTKPVVLIAEELSPATLEALGPDFEVRHCDGADRAALLPAIADADAILVRSATQAGVMVVNAPTSNITSAAELAVALLLASARNIAPASESLKGGAWKRSKYTGVEVSEKTVGVVGLGRIGQLVAARLAAFGVELIAYDPYVQPAKAAQMGIRMVSLDELLAQSDFITVHLPKTKETLGLIGEEALRKVKPTVHIINAARGGIVDEAALAVAISEGRVAGAGFDVFATEPCTDSPLFAFEQVVVTPHLGASTDEAQEKAGIAVAKSVRLALAGELVPDAVNVQGGVIDPDVRPGIPLAEELGTIAASLAEGSIASIDVEVLGAIAELDVNVLKLAALKGVFSALVTDPVSYVNAPVLAEQRGVDVNLTTGAESPMHRNVTTVRLTLTDGGTVSVSGTVSGPRLTRKIVDINGYDLDVPIAPHMAFFRYTDRPGVVGIVGNVLGEAQVNIAAMQVGRADSDALIVLTVDTAMPADVAAKISAEIGSASGVLVDLEV